MATSSIQKKLPLLEAGDHLDQTTFHALYKKMPASLHAELIGGVVRVPSPLSQEHGLSHALMMAWLVNYAIATPGTQAGDNMTTILGNTSEPQPDGALLVAPTAGGQTHISEDGYTTGPPEFIVEVASSSASIDLHAKRRDYEQAGVQEYLVVTLRQGGIHWFVLQEGRYRNLLVDADGVMRSRIFPDLWLSVEALLQRDGAAVMRVLQQGLAIPEHAAFVQRLATEPAPHLRH